MGARGRANLDFEIGTEMSRRSFEDEDPALDRVAGGDWPDPLEPGTEPG
jgi:hypothetical protein